MRLLNGAAAAALAGALLLAAPALRADQKGKDHGHGHWDRFELLKKKLELSDSQVEQWKKAEKGQREEGKLLRDKTKVDTDKLAVLVDEKAADDKLSAALDALAADHKAEIAQREKFLERLRGILSPTQQAKAVLLLLDHGRRGRFGHGHKGWGGPGSWQGHGHGPDGQGPPDGGGPWDGPGGD